MDLIGDIVEHETDLNQPPDLSNLQNFQKNAKSDSINDSGFAKPTKWKLRLKNKKLNSMSNYIDNDNQKENDGKNDENDENLSKLNSMSLEEKNEFKDELLSLNPKILNILINRSEKKYGKSNDSKEIKRSKDDKDSKDTKNEIVDLNRELNKDELNSIFPVIEGPGTWIGGENKNSNLNLNKSLKSQNEIVNIYENGNGNEIVSQTDEQPSVSSSSSLSSGAKSVPISPSLKPALRKKSTDPELDQLPASNLSLEKKVRFNKEAKINYLESSQINNNNNNNASPQKLSRFKKNLKNNNLNGNNNNNNSNNGTSGSNKSIKSKISPSSSPLLTPKKIKNKNKDDEDDDWEDITYISDNSQYVEPTFEESKKLSKFGMDEAS
ncbi:unnamed protein product [[Candida] boidinii]|uniref:Unnamed protein product n=1 Tax=Candida boidinii TaxID=5477 RepID=A0A9W6WJF2_CANBO|nr:unnamed protein product [[Candida] boidinii]